MSSSLQSFHAFPWIRRLVFALTLLGLSLAGSLASAEDIFSNSGRGSGQLSIQDDFLPVEKAFRLSASLEGRQLILDWWVAPRYYLYQERFVFRSQPSLELTPGFQQGLTKFDEFFEKNMTVFYDRALVTIDLPENAPVFVLSIESQGCADAGLCYPPYTQNLRVDLQAGLVESLSADALPDVSSAPQVDSIGSEGFVWTLLLNIGFALMAGVILNAMPCVFPVLSIKVLSLTRAEPERLALHGWTYTLGILLCFVGFALLLLAARASGEALGWGFQLQSSGLVTALVYLFFIMGLSLSGMLTLGGSWMGMGQDLTQQSGLRGSFFTGVLAAVVASPCTAPLMGVALGFALTQPTLIALLIFVALGLGMALPLLLLCYYPSLAHKLPKPGPWMDNLKQLLAFPLYLSALWLLWVLGRQTSTNTLMTVACGLLALVFAFWLMSKSGRGWLELVRRLLVVLSLACALLLPWHTLQPKSQSDWQAYSPALLQELRAEGKPVFVNLTADWCLTCLANERVSLSNSQVKEAFEAGGVVRLKGDWTNTDPQITALLDEYGRSGVPLYLWFPAGHSGKGIILPQILTPGLVIETLKTASSSN